MGQIHEKIEKSIQREEDRKIKKSVIRNYYRSISLNHEYFMRRLVNEREGDFCIGEMRRFMLANEYRNNSDREIALFFCLLIRGDDFSDIIAQTNELRSVLTEHPYQCVMSREFMSILPDRMRNNYTGKICNHDLIGMGDMLYDCIRSFGSVKAYFGSSPMKDMAYWIADVLASCTTLRADRIYYAVQCMLVKLCGKDREGLGLWDMRYDIYPLAPCHSRFVKIFFVRTKDLFSLKEISEIMGFKSLENCFYASLAYEEARRLNPAFFKEYEMLFRRILKNRKDRHSHEMKRLNLMISEYSTGYL